MNLEERLARGFLHDQPSDAAHVLERLTVEERSEVLRHLSADAVPAVSEMLPATVAESVAQLGAADGSTLVVSLPPERGVAVLRRLPADAAERTLGAMSKEKQDPFRRALRYRPGTVGALMDPVIVELPVDIVVSEARLRLRRSLPGPVHEVFIVDRTGLLVGSFDVADLLRAGARTPVRTLMRTPVDALAAWMPAAAVRAHRGWDASHALPVVDEAGHLQGALRYETLRRLEREAEARGQGLRTSATVLALGELFHLGLAGFIEAVAATAVSREDRGERGEVPGHAAPSAFRAADGGR